MHLDKHGSTITRTHGHHSTAARACDGCTWTNTGQPLHARTAITQRPLEPATGAPGQTRVNHYTHARTAITQRPLEPATGAPGQTRVNHYTHARTTITQRPLEPATGAPGQTRVNHYTHAHTHGHHSTAARACDGCTWTNIPHRSTMRQLCLPEVA